MLRMSGPDSLRIAREVFRGGRRRELPPRTAVYGRVVDAAGGVIDHVLLTWFPGPASFTGEDVVEIACHGGVLVTGLVLRRLLEAGAESAGPGEFTRRAFLNGKMDLTQAEAVMDVISAQTEMSLRAARRQLEGALGREVGQLRANLLGILAHVEAYIDFPEEDIDPDTGEALLSRMAGVAEGISRLVATAGEGRILREGLRTVIAGAPNAGKSSLLNRLSGFERAIVSELPGTTRDTIEEVISLRGFPLRLVDTAGLRDGSGDRIEEEGMERARRQLASADLVLEVVDATLPPGSRALPPVGEGVRHLLVLNKSDLGRHPGWEEVQGIPVSCRTGDGLEALADRIVSHITDGKGVEGGMEIAVSARHRECLERALRSLRSAMDEFRQGAAPEFPAVDLRAAMDALGEVAGRVDTEELLGEIFSRFCIGK